VSFRATVAASAFGIVYAGAGLTNAAFASGADTGRGVSAELKKIEREARSIQSIVDQAREVTLSVDQRLANGELLYRDGDYARAAATLSEIIEKYPDTPSLADAVWLRAETYYAAEQYLSARRDYQTIVTRGGDALFRPYLSKSLVRLVDLSLRTGHLEGLNDLIEKVKLVSGSQIDGAFLYAKGRALFALGDLLGAAEAFSLVPKENSFAHQAGYYIGLVSMKQSRGGGSKKSSSAPAPGTPPPDFSNAIAAFQRVTTLPATTADARHVVDLSWLAVARLRYEAGQYTEAAEAYAKLNRDSPEFDTMLFELAWVYVRLGDTQRAERSLEVLSVTDPSSPYAGDGALLRGDLLLRGGSFDSALSMYESVRGQYDPLRAKVDAFLSGTPDPAVFYAKLVDHAQVLAQARAEGNTKLTGSILPPVAFKWAQEAEDGPMAFGIVEEIAQCKTLLENSRHLDEKLTMQMASANRVRLFPALLMAEERAISLINRISRTRLELARALDDEEADHVAADIIAPRDARRFLMGVIQEIPTEAKDFIERDEAGARQWNDVSQGIAQRRLELEQLQTKVDAIARLLGEENNHLKPDVQARMETELAAHQEELKGYRQQLAVLRKDIEFGKSQVGLTDLRFQHDAAARRQFTEVLTQEMELAAKGHAGPYAPGYAKMSLKLLASAAALEASLFDSFKGLEAHVAERTAELRTKVEAERVSLEAYGAQLNSVDNDARDVVGRVARRNFGFVSNRLRGIVLRADVGIAAHAWEVREEELARVRNLQAERAREEQLLDQEMREVLDDAGESVGAK